MSCTFGDVSCTFGDVSCTFGDVSCTFGDVCKPSGLWLSHLKSPKYYKVFINKKKYKARESVRFVFIYLKYKQQTKENIKGKFLTKLPKYILRGKPPFLFEKIPQVQKRAEKERKRGIHVFESQI